MNNRRRAVGFVLLLALVGGFAGFTEWRRSSQLSLLPRSGLESLPAVSGNFTRITGPQELTFPRDFGAHPDTQTEWWYYTGNLDSADGRRFGFQLTFFRRALAAADQRAQRASDWGANQAYLAHFTLTDVNRGQFHAFERLERGAAGLAGAETRVWLHDWQVSQEADGSTHVQAAQEGVGLDLVLVDHKGITLQGDHGYSRKGPEPGNASIYFSQTRLAASGKVTVNGETLAVSGLSWMDHEFSTSALSAAQIGWDWFSLQLDDGSEVMVYTLRRADGSVDPYSQGMLIRADGTTLPLRQGDFQVTAEQTWRSPTSGGVYPSTWKVDIPAEKISLEVRPLVADQELNLSFIYWEGAVEVSGQRDGHAIQGRGYVELTGYAQSLAGRF